jgi:hypothetical protein
VARTEGARARRRAHRSTASGRSGAPMLAGGGAKEREEHRELGSGLTGARVAAWRPSYGGAEPEAATLGGSEALTPLKTGGGGVKRGINGVGK